MQSLTLFEVIARFETWAIKHLSRGTVLNYRRLLNRFAQAVGNIPAQDLRAHHLLEWGTTWHEIQAVQRCFNWACGDAELIERTPFNRVKRPRLGQRKRIFDRAELVRFLRSSPTDFRAYLLALRETIARPQEIRAIQWDMLRACDPQKTIEEAFLAGECYFELQEFKAKERRRDADAVRVIPVPPRLARMLLRAARGSLPVMGSVFETSRGRAWTKEAVRLRMKRLRKKLGIVPDKRGETLVAYSIRHTSATNASANGIRDRTLADLMGHTTTRTTARYQHLQTIHLLEAMNRLAKRRRLADPDKS